MYTDQQIEQALEGYCRRTDAVRDILKFLPLNRNGIQTIIHSGERFCVAEVLEQKLIDGALIGQYHDKLRFCQEMVLNANPGMPELQDLIHLYAGIVLDVEKSPFLMVSYHDKVWEYVVTHATTERIMPPAYALRTEKDVPFILVREETMHSVVSWKEIFWTS